MNIELDNFNGPLDLLLHLVKVNKLDIYNINIELITKEYIDYINNTDLSINTYSEYLVMASELIHLKSKLLLNNSLDDNEDDEEYEINNEEELQRRLLEYQKIKDLTEDFRSLEEKRSNVYTKIPSNLNEFRDKASLNSDVSLNDLLKAFEEFLKRQKMKEPITTTVTKRELSVEKRVNELRNILKEKQKVNFLELFDDVSKPYVIVTFLSILDMTKNKEARLTQKNNFGEIFIEGCN